MDEEPGGADVVLHPLREQGSFGRASTPAEVGAEDDPVPPGEPVAWFDPNTVVAVRARTIRSWANDWFSFRRNFVAENIVRDSFFEYLDEQFGDQPGGPSFGESLVPLWGPARDGCASINNGRYGRAIQNAGWFVLDAVMLMRGQPGSGAIRGPMVAGSRAAVAGWTRSELRALARIGAKETAKKTAREFAGTAGRKAARVITERSVEGPGPIGRMMLRYRSTRWTQTKSRNPLIAWFNAWIHETTRIDFVYGQSGRIISRKIVNNNPKWGVNWIGGQVHEGVHWLTSFIPHWMNFTNSRWCTDNILKK